MANSSFKNERHHETHTDRRKVQIHSGTFQKDQRFRESQTVHNWDEAWCGECLSQCLDSWQEERKAKKVDKQFSSHLLIHSEVTHMKKKNRVKIIHNQGKSINGRSRKASRKAPG